jgi:hypothetical protein
MTTTRTQQNLSDKEIDFKRKDENDSKVTIIKKWGEPDRFLDQYFNNREKWDMRTPVCTRMYYKYNCSTNYFQTSK